MARSYAAVSALGVSPSPIPPISQTRPPTSVADAYCRGDGASAIVRHLSPATVVVFAGFPERSSKSASLVGPTCPGSVAPPIAYSEPSSAATATPCRAVGRDGSCDHEPFGMSYAWTSSETLVVPSPPTATTRPVAYATPTLPLGFGMASSFVQLSAAGS
jgi:hypothetical protein